MKKAYENCSFDVIRKSDLFLSIMKTTKQKNFQLKILCLCHTTHPLYPNHDEMGETANCPSTWKLNWLTDLIAHAPPLISTGDRCYLYSLKIKHKHHLGIHVEAELWHLEPLYTYTHQFYCTDGCSFPNQQNYASELLIHNEITSPVNLITWTLNLYFLRLVG